MRGSHRFGAACFGLLTCVVQGRVFWLEVVKDVGPAFLLLHWLLRRFDRYLFDFNKVPIELLLAISCLWFYVIVVSRAFDLSCACR